MVWVDPLMFLRFVSVMHEEWRFKKISILSIVNFFQNSTNMVDDARTTKRKWRSRKTKIFLFSVCFRPSMVHEPVDGIQKAGSTTLPRGAGSSTPAGPPAQPPNTRKCPVHCNSLWSIWYGLAVLALQGYTVYKFKK